MLIWGRSCSGNYFMLTLYVFWNGQDLSVIETVQNKRFYSKHTQRSPFWRFSVQSEIFCKTLQFRYKRYKKTACNRQHFCKQRICSGGGLKNSRTELIWGRSDWVNYFMRWADERENWKQGLLKISCFPQTHSISGSRNSIFALK